MSSTRGTAPSSPAASVLRCNKVAAKALPPSDETWPVDRVRDTPAERCIGKFVSHGIVEAVGTERHTGHRRTLYQTDPGAERHAAALSIAHETPCGHTGVRNLGDGEYTCCADDCDARFDRATALEVAQG